MMFELSQTSVLMMDKHVACRHVAVRIGPAIELLPIADPPPDKVPVVHLK
jgi:hypothetical protein